jgi:tRNA pseudouridine38-40 synthase
VTDQTERRYKFTLQYDGARFSGWQIQPGERTVQAELESALSRLTDRRTRVMGAGRTDAGVHAIGQVASAKVPARWSAEALGRALNAVLPEDVWVSAVEEVTLEFHARYDAVARGYIYRVGTHSTARSPFLRRWCWPLGREMDATSLKQTAAEFEGTHSFQSFSKAGQPERGVRCTVLHSAWVAWEDLGYEYRVVANRFLHHMVRYMVGTMVDIGRGRRPASDVTALLCGDAQVETSPPAPAQGLFLMRVHYDESEFAEFPVVATPLPHPVLGDSRND